MEEILFGDEDYRLWMLLWHVQDAIYKAREKELSKYGISPMKASVLFTIQIVGHRATPAEISRWLPRKPHAVSTLLTRMEKDGLVQRTKDLERKNLVRISMTEKGQQICSESNKRESIHLIMSSLSEEERRQLMSLLFTLRDTALEQLTTNSKPPNLPPPWSGRDAEQVYRQ